MLARRRLLAASAAALAFPALGRGQLPDPAAGTVAPKLGDDVIKTRLYETKGHHRNFLDCVKSRQPTVTPVETAHRSATPGHLALISFLTNRSIKWDPAKEEIIGDADASKLLTREYRGPWKLEA